MITSSLLRCCCRSRSVQSMRLFSFGHVRGSDPDDFGTLWWWVLWSLSLLLFFVFRFLWLDSLSGIDAGVPVEYLILFSIQVICHVVCRVHICQIGYLGHGVMWCAVVCCSHIVANSIFYSPLYRCDKRCSSLSWSKCIIAPSHFPLSCILVAEIHP